MLNPKKSLKDQGIYKADSLTVTLRKRLFFTETTNYGESCDEKELNRTYMQLQNAIITGVYSCTMSCDIAVELAALQCCIEDEKIDEQFLDHKRKHLLPHKYVKVRGITSTILEVYDSLDQELRESSKKAKSEYIRLCTTLDGYGITLFPGKVGNFESELYRLTYLKLIITTLIMIPLGNLYV